MRDCLNRNEAPFASHLLYTQAGILNDQIPIERDWGITAGLEWAAFAEASVVYVDRGVSRGMRYGMEHARKQKRIVEFRTLKKTRPNEGAGRIRSTVSLLARAFPWSAK